MSKASDDLLAWSNRVMAEHGMSDWSVVASTMTTVLPESKTLRIKLDHSQRDLAIPSGGWDTHAIHPKIGVALAIARAKGGGRTLGVNVVRETFLRIIDDHFQPKET